MPYYYVNTEAQPNGDHEVHEGDCTRLPSEKNRKYLGWFATCAEAVAESKKNHYWKSNGCYWCSRACHTT